MFRNCAQCRRCGRDLRPCCPLAGLTPQEKRILELIGEGLTNRQIGEKLFLAEKTVKDYISALFAKLGMERRTQAAAYAARVFGEHRGEHGSAC
jgi:DNA-binding NarL/FixJ family response regulator